MLADKQCLNNTKGIYSITLNWLENIMTCYEWCVTKYHHIQLLVIMVILGVIYFNRSGLSMISDDISFFMKKRHMINIPILPIGILDFWKKQNLFSVPPSLTRRGNHGNSCFHKLFNRAISCIRRRGLIMVSQNTVNCHYTNKLQF